MNEYEKCIIAFEKLGYDIRYDMFEVIFSKEGTKIIFTGPLVTFIGDPTLTDKELKLVLKFLRVNI